MFFLRFEKIGSGEFGYEEELGDYGGFQYVLSIIVFFSLYIYQVYSFYNVEFYEDNYMLFLKISLKFISVIQFSVLIKSFSKDFLFLFIKFLLDFLGGFNLVKFCLCYGGDMSQNLGSESGIVSEGDIEIIINFEMCLFNVVDGFLSNFEIEYLDL